MKPVFFSVRSRRRGAIPVGLCLVLVLSGTTLQAEVKLSKVFGPHMVLQRDAPVPVWGTAAPGEGVSVSFRGQKHATVADAQGQWRVTLAPLRAGGPDVMMIGGTTIDDVLVGEVWVGSGQSNMDMSVKSCTASDPALAKLAAATYPRLRMLRRSADARWEESNPVTNAGFSALLFAFGQALQEQLGVPVGVMVGADSGTSSGVWLTEQMLQGDAACQELVKRMVPVYDYEGLKAKFEADKASFDRAMLAWTPLAEAAKKAGKQPPPRPVAPAISGVGRAGAMNHDRMGSRFEAFIRPYVGYRIRGVLWDQGESKTNVACIDQHTLMGALIKGWRKEWGQEFPFLYVQKPSGGGTAWDPKDPLTAAARTFESLPAAIPAPEPADYSHELHLRLMSHPGTFMVTSSDLGAGLHPVLKSSYGRRAAWVAMGAVYGKKHEIYGPLYAGHAVEGDRMRIHFAHTGQGLVARHGETLQGFMIAGADKQFRWADAVIDGRDVVVSSPAVPKPEAARYAWAATFAWANLFNKDGLPAQPFRTDAW